MGVIDHLISHFVLSRASNSSHSSDSSSEQEPMTNAAGRFSDVETRLRAVG